MILDNVRSSWLVIVVLALLVALAGSLAVPTAGANGAEGGGEADWATWEQRPDPVFSGQYIASDPTVLSGRPGEPYRMFYTCYRVPDGPFDPDTVRSAICAATSPDGFAWTEVAAGDPTTPGLVLAGREGEWDENLEGSFALYRDGRYLLYYSGYRHIGYPALGYPAALAVAESTDGITFTRVSDGPILPPTAGWYDNDAVYSPAIVESDDGLVMVYAGHCYTDCERGFGNTLLGATSPDGIAWEKIDEPILRGGLDGADWTGDGVAEPGLTQGPDGRWYLFFTGLAGEGREIGIAVGDTPLGPWQVNPEAIVGPGAGFDRSGTLAPSVLIEGSRVRLWYLGMAPDEDIAIGYAETAWPLIVGSGDRAEWKSIPAGTPTTWSTPRGLPAW